MLKHNIIITMLLAFPSRIEGVNLSLARGNGPVLEGCNFEEEGNPARPSEWGKKTPNQEGSIASWYSGVHLSDYDPPAPGC